MSAFVNIFNFCSDLSIFTFIVKLDSFILNSLLDLCVIQTASLKLDLRLNIWLDVDVYTVNISSFSKHGVSTNSKVYNFIISKSDDAN